MAKYNARNNTDSVRNLAIERAKYKLEAFGESRPEQVVDFNFAERNCYGRIDYNRNAVIPKPEYLKTVTFYTSDQSTSLMVGFVADAFNDMRNRMIKACRLGILSKQHPFLSQIEIIRAYTSPTKMYREYMDFVISKYNNEYLPSLEPKTVVSAVDVVIVVRIWLKFLAWVISMEQNVVHYFMHPSDGFK